VDHGAWVGTMGEATRSAIYLSISFNFLRPFQYHVRHGVIRGIFQYSLHVYSFYSLLKIYRYTAMDAWNIEWLCVGTHMGSIFPSNNQM
jgi:hypothetical protein